MTRISTLDKFILEKRRNPEINPKEDPWDTFQKYYAKYGSNLFISFTDLEKLGVNIRSEYKTPLGIYSYPAEYVHSLGSIRRVPFAGDAPYVNFFTAKQSSNIVNLHLLDKKTADEYIEKAKAWYLDRSLDMHATLSDAAKAGLKSQIEHVFAIVEKEADAKYHTIPGGKLWYYTWKLTKFAVGDNATNWNILFRKYLGIDGVVDMGCGFVHPNEPTQAVFFSKAAVTTLDRVRNIEIKAPEVIDDLSFNGRLNSKIRNSYRRMTDDELMHHLDAFAMFTNPSERVQRAAIDLDPKNIKKIKNPSEEMKAYAVKAQAKIDIANMKKSFGF